MTGTALDYMYFDDTTQKEVIVQGLTSSPGVGVPGLVAVDPVTGQINPNLIQGAGAKSSTAFEALAANDLVTVFDDGGTFKIRKADASSPDTEAIGFVMQAYTAGATATYFVTGEVSGQSGLDPLKDVFLSETAGAATQTAPVAGTGAIKQKVGRPSSATQFCFNPDRAVCRP